MSSNAQPAQLNAGDVVAGRFRIVEMIGSGGFSMVYRAHQEAMNRFVALKVLKPTASDDETLVERFRREALFASHLSHPNTIELFDYGQTDQGLCFIAMELLIGTDLGTVVQLGRSMDLTRVWHILVQCCQSLAEAHKLGLVHRDLKPENIFLVQREPREFIKVLDFGVSKAVSDFADAGPRTMAPLTQQGTVFGTPLYMAPEQAMAESLAPSVDVYALGHIAFEMITGRAKYADCSNAMDVMLNQINDPPLAVPERWSETPFAALITRCTIKEPDDRIQDASQLLDCLMDEAFVDYMTDQLRPPEGGCRFERVRTLPEMPAIDEPLDDELSGTDSGGLDVASSQPASARADDRPVDDEARDPDSARPTSLLDKRDRQAVDPRDETEVAFDTVLGCLAQLGDRVPEELWKLARARVLPAEFMGLADFIVAQARRFGIIQRQGDTLEFAEPGFVAELRQHFDTVVEPVSTHLQLAELMRGFYRSPDQVHIETIARHLRGGRHPYEAMQLLTQAGKEAVAVGDLDAARNFYIQIRQLLEDVDRGELPVEDDAGVQAQFSRARAWLRLGEAHGALGEHGAAEDALSEVIAPRADTAPELRGRAFKLLADLAVSQERYGQAQSQYRRARDCFREAGHPGAFTAAMGAMGHCALMGGHLQEAEQMLRVALQRAKRLQNDVLEARLGRFMGQVSMRQAVFGDAIEAFESSLATFERIDSQKEIVETIVQLGQAGFADGQFGASQRYFRRGASLAGTHGVSLDESAHVGLGRTFAAIGDLAQASAHLERAFQEVGVSHDYLQQGRIQLLLGDIDLAGQRFEPALKHFQEAEATAERLGHTALGLAAAIRCAYQSYDGGDTSEAYGRLSQTMERAAAVGDAGHELQVRSHIIYLQLLDHDFRTRHEAFQSLIDRSHKQGFGRAQLLCQLFQCDTHLAHGEIDPARRLLGQARCGAARLTEYALLIPMARRARLVGSATDAPSGPDIDGGVAIGALIPPEVGPRRFERRPSAPSPFPNS